MRRVVHLEPLRRRDLVGTDHRAYLVVEHLGRRSRQRRETGVAQAREIVGQRHAERRRSLPDLERRERVHVHLRHGVLDRAHHRLVVVAVERGMDPALQAHLRRAAIPRLEHAPRDLVVRYEERRPAQVRRELALRERAEAAAEVTDVRVLDVARDDVADVVAADLAPQTVGRCEHALALLAARAEEACDLLLAELVARVDRQRIARHERHVDRIARRPVVLAREPEPVGEPQCAGEHGGIEPLAVEPLGIDRQPRCKLKAAALRRRRAAARARATAPRDSRGRSSRARRRPSRRCRRRAAPRSSP